MAGVASRAIELKQRDTRKGQAAILHFLCPGGWFFFAEGGKEESVAGPAMTNKVRRLRSSTQIRSRMFWIAISIVEPVGP